MGMVTTVEDFQVRFGWDPDRLALDIWNACHCCDRDCLARRFSPRSITVYIIDPEKWPDYVTNAALLCPDCGREKRRLSPDKWISFRRLWAEWRVWYCQENPTISLLGGTEEAAELKKAAYFMAAFQELHVCFTSQPGTYVRPWRCETTRPSSPFSCPAFR